MLVILRCEMLKVWKEPKMIGILLQEDKGGYTIRDGRRGLARGEIL